MRFARATCLTFFGLLPLFGCAGISQSGPDDPQVASDIINGTAIAGYPAVVQVHSTAISGSGTLIGTRTVLTAAHVSLDDWEGIRVLVPSTGQVLRLVGGATHPDYVYEGPDYHHADATVLRLADDVRDVAPIPLMRDAPELGETIELLGWGTTRNGGGDYGTVLRSGHNQVDQLDQRSFSYFGLRGEEATICNGDSGGPSLIVRGGVAFVAGIHSRGSCELRTSWFRDDSYGRDTRVDAHYDWIASEAAGNLFDGRTYERAAPTGRIELPSFARADEPVELRFHVSDDVRLRAVTVQVDGKSVLDEPSSGTSATHVAGALLEPGAHLVSLRVRDGANRETLVEDTLVVQP